MHPSRSFGCVASRYDKSAYGFHGTVIGTVILAAIRLWLRS
ncbi:hypothetical protein [Streptomyces katrae]|nr:hypothetical protein [Streptomyces katrae]